MKRSQILPLAILLAFLFHEWCDYLAVTLPYLIFSILLLNFTSVNIKSLKLIHISKMTIWLLLFQIVVSLGGYYLINYLFDNEIVAQGVLVGVLCPVAASSVVISCILGANRETVTTHVILGNLMVAVVAPIYFSFIGEQQSMPFLESFVLILRRVSPIIALPFFVAMFLQLFAAKVNRFISRFEPYSLHIWAAALTITLGQTISFIIDNWKDNFDNIIILGAISIVFCAIQFGVGKLIGKRYGDVIAGGQMLGQKNVAMGIWMSNIYLNPIASVFLALYSVWQNLFNSWQLHIKEKK